MEYQLVLQFPAYSIRDWDEMVELEETIAKGIGNFGTVDGHDAGTGEVNIFIITERPKLVFEKIKSLIGTRDFMPSMRVAYREMGKGDFTIIHPAQLNHFTII